MPELFALGDGVCPVENVDIRGEPPAMAASGVPRPASGTMLRQVSPQFDGVTVREIGEVIDRLMMIEIGCRSGRIRPAICCGDQPCRMRPITD
jgi:hypothetical protein